MVGGSSGGEGAIIAAGGSVIGVGSGKAQCLILRLNPLAGNMNSDMQYTCQLSV